MLVYMQVEGIAGVGGAARPDWVNLETCAFGFSRTETSTEGTSVPSSDQINSAAKLVTVTKLADRSTPAMATWMNSAEPRTVDIEYCVNPTLWLVGFTLFKARLRSYEATYSDAVVTETMTIAYDKIQLDYYQQDQTNRDAAMADFEFPATA